MADKYSDEATERIAAEVGAYPGLLSRVSWGAIFAGAACAIAAHLVLSMIGLSVGFAVVDPAQERAPLEGIGLAAGIWTAISSLIALFAGGWVAGRLAGLPRDVTGALHGATVWALVTLFSTSVAVAGISSAISGTASMVTQAGQVAGQAAAKALPDDLPNADLPIETLNSLLPGIDLEQRLSIFTAQNRQRQTQRDIRQEAREIVRQVVSRQEQQKATQAVESAATDIIRTPADAGRDIDQLLDRLFASPDAIFSQEDRTEVANILQNRLGVSKQEAEQVVERWQANYQVAAKEAKQAWQNVKQETTQLAQSATDTLTQASGWTAFALMLGLLAAALGGLTGRPEDGALIWSYLPRRRT